MSHVSGVGSGSPRASVQGGPAGRSPPDLDRKPPMPFTGREFIRGGVSAFTFSFAAPAFRSDLARAQGTARCNLVVLYLSGGNDALSMLIPYTDAQYYARRPVLGIPAANVIQIGSDKAGNALRLKPQLAGLKTIFDTGKLALIQRTGYENLSRSHFQGTHLWATAHVANTPGPGLLGPHLRPL